MSGKKFLIILVGLAVVSFGVSLGVSLLTGGEKPTPAGGGKEAQPQTGAGGLLAKLAREPETRTRLLKQQRLEELIKDLQARMRDYERKERKLAEREGRIRQAEEDLIKRGKDLEKLRMELVGPLTRLKDAVAELDRSRVLVDKHEKTALVAIAAKYDKMDPTKGAETLSSMYLAGQEEDVIRILHYMTDRVAAKLLENMTSKDPKSGRMISAEVTARMKRVQEQG